MPSRPRPLPRARRSPFYLLARPRRPRGRGPIDRDDGAAARPLVPMLYDGPRAELPIATLLASGSQTRRRIDLDRWLSLRWDWVRPRAVPLLAAFVGLLLTLGAVKYTSLLSYDRDQLPRPRPARPVPTAGSTRAEPAAAAHRAHRGAKPPIYQGPVCEGVERETR
jgi:hypothetical protein